MYFIINLALKDYIHLYCMLVRRNHLRVCLLCSVVYVDYVCAIHFVKIHLIWYSAKT